MSPKTESGKKGIDAGGVTLQRDQKVIYRRKRMPRRKRQAWKKFVQKVKAVNEKEQGTRTVILRSNDTFTVASQQQQFHACHLLGYTGNLNDPGDGDMKYIITKDSEAYVTQQATTGEDIKNPNFSISKFKFTSAKLQLDIQNTGTVGLILDLYWLEYNQKTTDANFDDCHTNGVTKTIPIEDPSSNYGDYLKPQLTDYGVTLFDLGQVISRGKFTIRKVKTYNLPSGDVITEQLRDARTYIVNGEDLKSDNNKFGHPKYTETVLIVARNPAASTAGQFTTSCVRTYKYKINGVNETAAARI